MVASYVNEKERERRASSAAVTPGRESRSRADASPQSAPTPCVLHRAVDPSSCPESFSMVAPQIRPSRLAPEPHPHDVLTVQLTDDLRAPRAVEEGELLPQVHLVHARELGDHATVPLGRSNGRADSGLGAIRVLTPGDDNLGEVERAPTMLRSHPRSVGPQLGVSLGTETDA
jgi:hypothetical protein